VAGLDPAIHASLGRGPLGFQDRGCPDQVRARGPTVVLWRASLDLALPQLLNRTAVDLIRASTPWLRRSPKPRKTWTPTDQVRGLKARGSSPATGIFGCLRIVATTVFSQPDSRGSAPAVPCRQVIAARPPQQEAGPSQEDRAWPRS